MNLAYISLAALVVAILVSCFTELNVGILALALAYVVGVFLGGMKLDDVTRGFPISLFLTLAGVTMLFTQAQLNGTLDRLSRETTYVPMLELLDTRRGCVGKLTGFRPGAGVMLLSAVTLAVAPSRLATSKPEFSDP
jgi:hypothetical protein